MSTGELFIGITGIIATVVIFIIPLVNNIFFKRPKIAIEIVPNEGFTKIQTHLGYSSENDRNLPVNRPDRISIYEFEWIFNLVIINNSETNAFKIKIYYSNINNALDFKKNISYNKALKSHQEIVLPFIFKKIVHTMHKDIESHFTYKPSEFDNMVIILEYKNQYGTKFYSKYDMNSNSIYLKKISKKEIQKLISVT